MGGTLDLMDPKQDDHSDAQRKNNNSALSKLLKKKKKGNGWVWAYVIPSTIKILMYKT